jgi:hypothetical protein
MHFNHPMDIKPLQTHGMTAQQRLREGALLKSYWQKNGKPVYKTQILFCDHFGLNQGYLQQMFSGTTAISLETMLDLAIPLKFDPRDIRPSIGPLYEKMQYVLDKPMVDEVAALPKATLEQLKHIISLAEKKV